MKLGQKIRDLRKKKNITGLELANLAQVSQSTISRIERDEQSPTIETLMNICNALEVPLAELLFEELIPFPPHMLRFFESSRRLTEKELEKITELIEVFLERTH